MFERRLKIFLFILLAVTGVLLVRAMVVQVVEQDQWRSEASKTMQRPKFTETTRGRILDFRDREVALDVPCTDACVEYAALTGTPSDEWYRRTARKRLEQRLGEDYTKAAKSRREALVKEEIEKVKK